MGRRQQTDGSLALEQKKVIVIEAAQRPEAQKLRVAAYCRVSSDSSDQMNSFAAQLNYYTTLINSKDNWTMADIYADAGISGTSAEKRPDFQRLLTDCRRGRIDKILVKSISRFARNAVDCLETIRALKAIGVGVCFEEQGIDTSEMTGELLTAMFSAIAQKESESISGNMRWSYRQRMEKGTFLPSSMPFGYKIKDRSIVVDEAQAEIIRRIFNSYLAGQSMDEIRHNSIGKMYLLKLERKTGSGSRPQYPTFCPMNGILETPSGKRHTPQIPFRHVKSGITGSANSIMLRPHMPPSLKKKYTLPYKS